MRTAMQICPIHTDKDHRVALVEIEKLWVGASLCRGIGSLRALRLLRSGRLASIVSHLLPVSGNARYLLRRLKLSIVTPVDRGAVPNAEVIGGLFDQDA